MQKLSQLDKLSHLGKIEKLDNLSQLDKIEKLDNLKFLSNLQKLDAVEKLNGLIGQLKHMTPSLQLDKIIKDHQYLLQHLDSLNDLRHLEELNKLEELKSLEGLERLNEIKKLDSLNDLKMLENLQQLSSLESLAKIDELKHLETLEQLDKLEQLNQLEHIENLEQLEKLDNLKDLEKLNILNEDRVVKNIEKLNALSIFKDKFGVYIAKSFANSFLDLLKIFILLATLVILYINVIPQKSISQAMGYLGLLEGSRTNFALSILSGNLDYKSYSSVIEGMKNRQKNELAQVNLARGNQIFSPYNVKLYKSILSINHKDEFIDFKQYTKKLIDKKISYYKQSIANQLKYYESKNVFNQTQLQDIKSIYDLILEKKYSAALSKYLNIEKEDRFNIYSYLGRLLLLESTITSPEIVDNISLGYE